MDVLETYSHLAEILDYKSNLVGAVEQVKSPIQMYLFSETKRNIQDVDYVYFVGDIPVIYFKLLSEYSKDEVDRIHRLVWNQGRVPLLCVISPGEIRFYNCFAKPVSQESNHEERLIEYFRVLENVSDEIYEFSRINIDTGVFWGSKYGQRFDPSTKVDVMLLDNLRDARNKMHDDMKLSYDIIHSLLGRCIFVLYLEDRGAIDKSYYGRYQAFASSLLDIVLEKEVLYRFFDDITAKFNGNMFPVGESEVKFVNKDHLEVVYQLFQGFEVKSGQMSLWRLYDFRVIPIEFISAIYERFLHKQQGKGYVARSGAYYTPHALVEFILNELLPWPSEKDHNYNLKVLDPACGSGIFLVEAYRRLVARWMYTHDTQNVPIDVLRSLLTCSIFGVDINYDAIQVAAFSLYLALLDYIEPKTIWDQIQFPYLIYQPESYPKSGENLYPMSAFSELPFKDKKFDIVVGNPPWKRGDLLEDIEKYCATWRFAQESAQAFLWRVRDFVVDGRIAMVATSKILFNSEGGDKLFRSRFFSENYVEVVVNFSALRKSGGGRNQQLFASAVGPATVFFYRINTPIKKKSTVLYCVPKPTRVDDVVPGIVIDSSEFKFIPRDKCAESDFIWKVAMWGNQRDFDIIERIADQFRLYNYINEDNGWYCGRGLQKPGEGEEVDYDIAKLPMKPTNLVRRYWLSQEGIFVINKSRFFRKGEKKTYFAPHVLFKRGLHNKRICAAFGDFDCAFNDSIIGISNNTGDMRMLKVLTAYLNSSFATYFLFLTASMWGVERDRFNKSEVLALPGFIFEMSDEKIDMISNMIDMMRESLRENNEDSVYVFEQGIDKMIFNELGFSEVERKIVIDVIRYGVDLFQNGKKSMSCKAVEDSDLEAFAEAFCFEANKILRFGQTNVWSTIFCGESPLKVVAVHFNNKNKANHISSVISSFEIIKTLRFLESIALNRFSVNIYSRRIIKIFDNDTVYIIKPSEKRLWSYSAAIRDWDEVMAGGLANVIAQ